MLTPAQCRLIRDKLGYAYRVRWDFLLHTRMRIEEGRYVAEHAECFREENRAIFLPNVESLGKGKARCTIKNRAVTLSDKGVEAVKEFFRVAPGIPAYQSMSPAFDLAASKADFSLDGITPKMLRKTMISWMMACFPERETHILMSAGHTQMTMRGHYLAHGFRREDIKDMKAELAGWE